MDQFHRMWKADLLQNNLEMETKNAMEKFLLLSLFSDTRHVGVGFQRNRFQLNAIYFT